MSRKEKDTNGVKRREVLPPEREVQAAGTVRSNVKPLAKHWGVGGTRLNHLEANSHASTFTLHRPKKKKKKRDWEWVPRAQLPKIRMRSHLGGGT